MSVGATPAAQRVRQCKFGGASRPWLPLWGSWRGISEPERVFAVANMGKVRRLQPGTLSVTAAPCQLSHRESQGAGVARPAQRVSRREFGGAAALGSPYGGAGERSASLRGRLQLKIWKKCGDCGWVPSQSRLSAVTALPKGEPRGGLRPPSLVQHNLPNRVTPSGVGQLPGPQARHCQRGHPAVLTFCTPSPARLPIYRQCTPPRLPGRWESGWGSGATCGSRSLWLSGGRCPGRSGRSGRPGRRG